MPYIFLLILDDRAVRDSERKAALMHFSTDQANELTQHPPKQEEAPSKPNPRVQQVQQLAKPPASRLRNTRDYAQILYDLFITMSNDRIKATI